MFNIYVRSLCDLLECLEVPFHSHADDSRLLMKFDPLKPGTDSLLNKIKSWMDLNMLSLNKSKAEIML